jgi:mannose-1-phosphate guanylyltransferase
MEIHFFRMPGPGRAVCGVLPQDDLSARLASTESRGGFLAVRADLLTRQPLERLPRAGLDGVAALTCTGRPWNFTCVFTDPSGIITGLDRNPCPEHARTNICLAGACWFSTPPPLMATLEETLSAALAAGAVIGAELFTQRAFIVCSGEEQLRASHTVLSGHFKPDLAGCSPKNGTFTQGFVDPSCSIGGTLWTAAGSTIGEGCLLENCVVLDNAVVGPGCRLRNTLVEAGTRVPAGTVMEDKYPSFLGECNA